MKMRRTIFVGLFAIFVLSVVQDQAFAWGATWMGASLEQMVNAARWRAGAFRYNAAFRLDNAGYDSDIYFGMMANPVPDYTITAGPDIQIFLPLKKTIVFDVSEFPRYVFFFDTKQERALNNMFAGRVHFVFDRFYIQAGGGLIDAKQRLSTEVNLNVRLKEDDLTGLVLWQASRETSFALQYRTATYNYENLTSGAVNISESLNRQESSVSFTAYLQQHSKTRFYLDGEYGSFTFAETISHFKDARSYGVYGGVEFLPSAEGQGQTTGVSGSINLGYKRLDVLGHGAKDYSGLAGNTGVSIGIMRFTAIRAFFSRGPQFSAYSGLSYYLQTIYGVGLARSLSRKTALTYDFYYGRNEYPGGEMIGGKVSGKKLDKYMAHSIGLNFRLGRALGLNLMANLGKRDSEFGPRPTSSHYFIGFSLTYGYSSGGLSMPGARTF
jgi:hypothetical protein